MKTFLIITIGFILLACKPADEMVWSDNDSDSTNDSDSNTDSGGGEPECINPCEEYAGGPWIPNCMGPCGGGYGSPQNCDNPLLNCVIWDPPDFGICLPIDAMHCEVDENCECFPDITPCEELMDGDTIWFCDQADFCRPDCAIY